MEISVLDAADHMAGLGFLPAVRRLDMTPPDGHLWEVIWNPALDLGSS